jgi:hypothetical protein
VSPLWPETIHIGLFPGDCWLHRRATTAQPFQAPEFCEPQSLLQALEKMLDEQGASLRKGSRLALTVSDSLAAIATLPWQQELRRDDEIASYARICFEKLGMELEDDCVMRAEFRQYGGTGLAYALPRAWMEGLLALIEGRGLRLAAVLPISAAAYCQQRFREREGRTLLLLQERNRTSAMIYEKSGLLDYDVEPVVGSIDDTRKRLLNRIGSRYDNIARVATWSTALTETVPDAQTIAVGLAEAELRHLERAVWNP